MQALLHPRWSAQLRVLVILVCAAVCTPLWSQFTSGLQATVVDPTGAIVVGAQVIVTNQATLVKQTAESNESGYVRIQKLPPGVYSIEVKAPAFNTWVQSDVRLEGNEMRAFYPKLTVGTQRTTVEVTGELQTVDTSQSTISRALEEHTISESPLVGENLYASIATLAPGVSGTGGAFGGASSSGSQGTNSFSAEPGFQINAAGQRQENNEYQIDGSSVNGNSRDGIANITPEPDTVAEMKITTTNFSAEKGRDSGALIEIYTKSGASKFHGSVSEMHTDNLLMARTEFQAKVPKYIRNDFGGNVGGPLTTRNNTFFFGSAYWMKGVLGQTLTGVMETSALRDWVASNAPNSVAAQIFKIAPAGIEPTANLKTAGDIASALPSLYPLPPIPANLQVVGTGSVSQSPINDGFQGHIRIDHNFRADNDRLFYDLFHNSTRSGVASVRPAQAYVSPNSTWFHKVDYIHTFSPSLVNEVSATYVRVAGYTPNNTPTLPNVGITGVDFGFSAWGTSGWVHNNFNYHDVLTYVRGAHNIRVGIDVDRQQDLDNFTNGDVRPSFSFTNILDFASDQPYSQSGPVVDLKTDKVANNLYSRILMLYAAPFVQDDWKVTHRLTINLGLRLDDFGHIATMTNGRTPFAMFTPGSEGTLVAQITDGTMKHRYANGAITDDTVLRLAPRVGFAWDVANNGSTSVRGGWGIFNNRLGNSAYSGSSRADTPDYANPSINIAQPGVVRSSFSYETSDTGALGFAPIPNLSFTLDSRGGLVGTTVAVGGLDPKMTVPLYQNWAISLQRLLGSKMMIEADYFGSSATKMWIQTDVNRYSGDMLQHAGKLTRLNSSFSGITYGRNIGKANSNVGSLAFTRRFSNGWTAHAILTYGKALDEISSNGNGVGNMAGDVIDPFDLSLQYGRSDFDVRKRLSFDGVWNTPSFHEGIARAITHGWTLSPVITLQSGQPFTVYTTAAYPTGDYNGDGFGFDIPNAPSFGRHVSTSRSDFLRKDGVFGKFASNPVAAFGSPTPGTEGNLGRNTYDGPGFALVNLSVSRVLPIHLLGDKGEFQIRGEFLNLFNRVNLTTPMSDLTSGSFGRSVDQNLPRQEQIIAHIRF